MRYQPGTPDTCRPTILWRDLVLVASYVPLLSSPLFQGSTLVVRCFTSGDAVHQPTIPSTTQYSLERALDKMQADWAGVVFETTTWRATGTTILRALDDIQMLLDDQIVKTQSMRASPYIGPFEDRVRLWEAKLSLTQVGAYPLGRQLHHDSRLLNHGETQGVANRPVYRCTAALSYRSLRRGTESMHPVAPLRPPPRAGTPPQETLDQWLRCQQGWLYLEPIFGSEDIMQQMPNEGRKFKVCRATGRTEIALCANRTTWLSCWGGRRPVGVLTEPGVAPCGVRGQRPALKPAPCCTLYCCPQAVDLTWRRTMEKLTKNAEVLITCADDELLKVRATHFSQKQLSGTSPLPGPRTSASTRAHASSCAGYAPGQRS